MNLINTQRELDELINKNIITVVYFSGTTCGACKVIKSRINDMLTKFSKIASCEINGEESIEIAAKYQVFSLPIMLLYIEGKETLRVGRNVDFLNLEKQISRYYDMSLN